LKKYQINKAETPETDTSASTKGNGKCKSIRNSEEMANRIKECAFKKSMTFVENMRSFYFLMNQIEDIENSGAQVIIKNEIATESLIPTVELNIKNEIIYPHEDAAHQLITSVIQQATSGVVNESKRKRRKNNNSKRKNINGQPMMEIDETGNLVARQQNMAHQSNLHITQQNDNGMAALMLTVKNEHGQQQQHHHLLQPTQIQIHSSEFESCIRISVALRSKRLLYF